MTFDDRTGVFDPEISFDSRNNDVSNKTRAGDKQTTKQRNHRRKWCSKAQEIGRSNCAKQAANETFPGFVGTYFFDDFVSAR